MLSIWKTTRPLALALLLVGLTLPARATDLDKLAPADAEAVIVINFKTFLESPLFKKHGEEAMKQAMKDERAAKMLEATGIDPMKDLKTLTVTFSGGQADPKVAVLLKGTFNVAKIQTTIEKEAKKAGDKLTIAKEGGQTFYSMTNPQGQEFTGTFLGNEDMVMSNNKDYLKAILAGKKAEPTDGSKVLAKTVAALGGKETMFMAFAITKEMKDALGNIPNSPVKDLTPKLEAITASLNLTNSIDMTLAIQATDAGTAKQLGQFANGLIPLAKLAAAGNDQAKPIVDALLKELKIGAEGAAVKARLQLTEDLLKSLRPGGEN